MQQALDTGGWLRTMLRETDNAASIPGAPVGQCRNPQAVPVGEIVTCPS